MVRSLKEEGFLVSLDNFGGMYSSLTSIKDLPIDNVKFERNFIRSTTSDERGKKILRNLFTLCKDLKVDILAIGVETPEQVETLVSCGCYKAQGYYYLEPSTEEEFIKYALSNSENIKKPIRFSFNGTMMSEDGSHAMVDAHARESRNAVQSLEIMASPQPYGETQVGRLVVEPVR